MIRASVIVPNREAGATLPRTLEALSRQRFDEPYEVIVVDDGSEDDSVEVAERFGPPVRVVRQGRLGPGPARNAGAAEARGEVLAFTDADCEPEAGWLAAGIAALHEADLVQGLVEPIPDFDRGPFDRTLWIDHETGLYETANLFIRRELFERLGGFEVWLEPDIGKALAEDVWLGWRARRSGARTSFCERARVHHAVYPRGPLGFIRERRRMRYFVDIAAQLPELRRERFFARIFFSRRSAAFDLFLVALACAARRRSPLPALAGLPYLRIIGRRALPWGRRAPAVAAAEIAADAVGFLSLLGGSLRRGTPLL
jgi:glycosyltransferase involved in cell wall biosynthesis